MGVNSDERVTRIHELDRKHLGTVHQSDLVNRDEEARLLKLRIVNLRDENARLSDKLIEGDGVTNALKRQKKELEKKLVEAHKTERKTCSELKKQGCELKRLEKQIEASDDSLSSLGCLRKEKVALEGELNKIKPELQQLRLQLEEYQSIVAANKELQHKLDSAEAELDNEKRSKQKKRRQEDDAALEEWESKVEELEKKLAFEKERGKVAKEQEKAVKEHEKKLQEANGRVENLEDQLDTVKTKFKSTKAELKKAQAELEQCQAELETVRKASHSVAEKTTKSVPTKAAAPSRKRRAHDLSIDDMTIGTPGPSEAAIKRPLKQHALLGEKSTFSVTPFLNRTKDVSNESMEAPSPSVPATIAPKPLIDDEEGEEEEDRGDVPESQSAEEQEKAPEDEAEEPLADVKKPVQSKASKTRGKPKTPALADAPVSKKNMKVSKKAQSKTNRRVPMLFDRVSEDSDEREQEIGSLKPKKGQEPKLRDASVGVPDGDVKKKRRKLGGGAPKTLFDEDEGEEAARPTKAQLAPGRRTKTNLRGPLVTFEPTSGFSPLKRSKRGANASYIV